MAVREDQRTQRTKLLLRTALLALIKEKGFDALTVQEIIDRAGVGRTTFYAHFTNKEELLLCGFDELRVLLKQHQRQARTRPEGWVFGFSGHMFEHANDHCEVFQAMVGRRSGAAVQQRFQSLLVELVREDVKLALPACRAKPLRREPIVQFIAGAFLGLLIWWLEERPQLTPADIDVQFKHLAMPAIAAAVGHG